MKLQKVTMTGADDSIDPKQLIEISHKYPFVEWGILASYSQVGWPRFPSYDWIVKLLDIAQYDDEFILSLHICGRWVRDICEGKWQFASRFGYLEDFERVQLNFHAYPHELEEDFYTGALYAQNSRLFDIIFQIDGVNNYLLEQAEARNIEAYPLYDVSGGAGRLPVTWGDAVPGVFTGYAGGLGPENLSEQLTKIALAAGNERFWVDMETRIRTIKGSRDIFDLTKVEKCLQICSPHIHIEYKRPLIRNDDNYNISA